MFDPSVLRASGTYSGDVNARSLYANLRAKYWLFAAKSNPFHEAPPAYSLDLWLERHELPAEVPPPRRPEPKTKLEHAAAARNQTNQQVRSR